MSSNEHSWDVVVVGGANFDYSVRAQALPEPGETVVGETLLEGPGGKGANQAVAVSRLEANVAFVGRVGADERGRRCLDQLETEDVDTSHVVIDGDAATGVALVMLDSRGEKVIMTAPGANLKLTPSDIERAAPMFRRAKVVLMQLECRLETILAAARYARASKALTVLDAAPPVRVPDELLAQIDVVRANASEAQAMTDIPVHDVDSARTAAHALRRRGVGAACIATKDGDLLVFGADEVWLPHQRVVSIDATGAGDAFAAGIAVGLAENQSLTEAAWLGCVSSALKTTRVGAQAGLPRRDEVDSFLASIRRDD
jgi:ribokinase